MIENVSLGQYRFPSVCLSHVSTGFYQSAKERNKDKLSLEHYLMTGDIINAIKGLAVGR